MRVKRLFGLIVIIFLAGIFAASASAQPSQKIVLHSNQEKNILGSKLYIKFLSVVEDSRCPVHKVCVWAGNAKVKIQLRKKGGKPKEFEANSNLEPRSITYKGYGVQLESLIPRPGEMAKAIATKNTAIFLVTKL